jgi:hypothetical protein
MLANLVVAMPNSAQLFRVIGFGAQLKMILLLVAKWLPKMLISLPKFQR